MLQPLGAQLLLFTKSETNEPSAHKSLMPKKSRKKRKQPEQAIVLFGSAKTGVSKRVAKRIKSSGKSDLPLLLGSRSKATQENSDLLARAFGKGQLVGVLDAAPGDIAALYGALGLHMDVPPDQPQVEFFALKRESDGVRQVTFHAPPEIYGVSEDREHINADGSKQISSTEIGTVRMFPSKAWSKARARNIARRIATINAEELPAAIQATEDNNILNLAEAFKDQRLYPVGVLNFKKKTLTNYFQITSFAYACHSANDNTDWYYVYQIGQFSPSNGFFRNAKRQRLWYVDNYKMNAWPTDFAKNTIVSLVQSSPDTTTGQRTATSSTSWSISGSVSYSDKGGQAGVTGGMSISNSLSISIPDLSINNKSVDQVNNAHWEFAIPRVSGKDDGCLNDLNPVVPIARNTFQPVNQWIWRADASSRGKGSHFQISYSFAVELVNTYIGECNVFGCNCDVVHQRYNPFPKGVVKSFQVPYPPTKSSAGE